MVCNINIINLDIIEETKVFLDEHMVFIELFLISATKLTSLRCGQYV